jgi:hypothetical protein
METSYRQIKERLGIDEALADSSEDETDQYICKLKKPNLLKLAKKQDNGISSGHHSVR